MPRFAAELDFQMLCLEMKGKIGAGRDGGKWKKRWGIEGTARNWRDIFIHLKEKGKEINKALRYMSKPFSRTSAKIGNNGRGKLSEKFSSSASSHQLILIHIIRRLEKYWLIF
jgi:hypothetical protein